MVVLGLAGIPDDEVGPERRIRFPLPDVGDATQEPLAVAPPPHPTQERCETTCCRERSKYGTPVSQTASISGSVRSDG